MNKNNVSRRMLFRGLGAAAATFPATAAPKSGAGNRASESYHLRVNAARAERDASVSDQLINGDEAAYPNRIASFSKGLPHNSLGEVDASAWNAFAAALATETHEAMEKVPMGCTDPARLMKFVNPGAGFAFDLQGADSHHMAMPAPPAFASAETAGEAVELYWMALARDIPFSAYAVDPIIHAASAELSRLTSYRSPKIQGGVTPASVFRGNTPGDLIGPPVSQFLWWPLPYGAEMFPQTLRSMAPGVDYGTAFDEWLSLQNGWSPTRIEQYDDANRVPRNGRDLAQWAHHDVLYGAYLNAALLLGTPAAGSGLIGGMNAPVSKTNPYATSVNQTGFGTWGLPHITAALGEVATRALKTVWYQKWFVHRRLRPEAYGGRIQNVIAGRASYPIHSDALHSAAVSQTLSRNGTALLPQAYPEGSPMHPAYGAGHATVAGACVTLLKAFFEENWVIPNPVVASYDGLQLFSYLGTDAGRITVGGELNKLAWNIASARSFAGVHWRSDSANSLLLGERVAIDMLRDQRELYGPGFQGFEFTRFDGRREIV